MTRKNLTLIQCLRKNNNLSMFKHQGDVSFYPYFGELPEKKLKHNGSFILALGEATGHRHVVTVERSDQMEMRQLPSGEFVMILTAPGTITHEEHQTIVLEPGTYRVGREREKDWFSLTTRKVVD